MESLLRSSLSIVLIIVFDLLTIIFQAIAYELLTKPLYNPAPILIRRAVLLKDHNFIKKVRDPTEFLRIFKPVDSITTIYKRCFDVGSGRSFLPGVNMAITKMLLPADDDLRQAPLDKSLRFTSGRLQKKFKLYISSKLLPMAMIILASSTICLALYVIFYYSLSESATNERLAIDLVILFLLPLLYASTFWFAWSRRVATYSKLFPVSILLCSGLYSIATGSDYALLGILVLQFTALNFDTSFPIFCYLTFGSIVLFIGR